MNFNIANRIKLSINKIDKNNFYHDLYKKIYGKNVQRSEFFNVGAGPSFTHPYWTNIDYISDWYKNEHNTAINYNLFSLEPLPIKSNTAKIFYTSHVIEHISDDAALNLFKEVFRCLDDNGVFRITCPDVDLAWNSIELNDKFFFEKLYTRYFNSKETLKNQKMSVPFSKLSNVQKFISQVCTARCLSYKTPNPIGYCDEDLLNDVNSLGFEIAMDKLCSLKQYPEILEVQSKNFGFHMNWWNKSKLIKFLELAGFTKYSMSGYGQSINPVLRDLNYFDNTEPKLSLYLEAYR